MLGNIIGINDNTILVKLNVELTKTQNLINMYIVFEEQNHLIVGEINDIKDVIAYFNLVGEFVNCKVTAVNNYDLIAKISNK